jgi:hypothetical protein
MLIYSNKMAINCKGGLQRFIRKNQLALHGYSGGIIP